MRNTSKEEEEVEVEDEFHHCCIVKTIEGDLFESTCNLKFNIGYCQKTYPPAIGDVILIEYSNYSTETTILVKNFKYLRSKTFLSQVTSIDSKRYIFDKKIFCDIDVGETRLKKSEKFVVVAVENVISKKKYNWRAVSVLPYCSDMICKPFEFFSIMNPDDKAEKSFGSYSDLPKTVPENFQNNDLLNEVFINPIPNIKIHQLYSCTIVPIWVTFNVKSSLTISGISIMSTNSVQQLSLDQSDGCEIKFPIRFFGIGHFSFNLNCTAKIYGETTEKLVISFNGLSISNNVIIIVGSKKNKNIERMLPISGPLAKQFCPRTPTASNIPTNVYNALELNDVQQLMPTLGEPLSKQNFMEKMKLFLFLEEFEKEKLYSSYKIDETVLHTEGDYIILKLNRMEDNLPFIIGDRVYVLPKSRKIRGPSEAYIHSIEGNKIFLKFGLASVVSTLKDQRCRVEFSYSRKFYKKYHTGIELVNERYGLKNLFPTTIKSQIPQTSYEEEGFAIVRNSLQQFQDKNIPRLQWINKKLNMEQKGAIRNILAGCSRPLPYIIFGPPGTGKTSTIVETILQIFMLVPHSRILVVTPTNVASDTIAERLLSSGIFGTHQLARLNGLLREKRTLPDAIMDYCYDTNDIQEIILYRVIICTSVVVASFDEIVYNNDHFTHLVLDEAGQMTEAESSIPLSFVAEQDAQVILAGDPNQLGPFVISHIANKYGYGVSMLSRLLSSPLYLGDCTEQLTTMMAKMGNINGHNSSTNVEMYERSTYDSRLITMLVRSYRSTTPLIQLSSELFYFNSLRAPQEREEDILYRSWSLLPNKNFPLLFYGVYGPSTSVAGSWQNILEATFVTQFVESLLLLGIPQHEIGVITPYQLQVKEIKKQLALLKKINFIDVASVEKFQGQERGAIIISTVRSYSPGRNPYHIGFVSKPERFNVSITRSKSLLVVIGDLTVLERSYYWNALICYCRINGALIDTRPGKSPLQQ